MEKFKKLDRAQMKKIQGGQPMCPCDDVVLCDCGGNTLCAFVEGNCENGGETPSAACAAAGCDGSASNACFDVCPL